MPLGYNSIDKFDLKQVRSVEQNDPFFGANKTRPYYCTALYCVAYVTAITYSGAAMMRNMLFKLP